MILECKNLVIGYENRVVLKGINFEINDGEYVCLFGDNGSGKSTLVKTILGLNSKLKGEINFAKDVSQRSIGYLPQHNDNLTDFPASVYEVVRSGCLNRVGFRPFYNKSEIKKTREMLKVLEIENLENRSFSELSGGQQQRVLLARALCATDKVLILDDSTSAVDTKTDAYIRKGFKEFIPGITKIIIAQRVSSVQDADFIIVMDNGEINGIGTHEELLKNNAIYQEVYEIQNRIGKVGE